MLFRVKKNGKTFERRSSRSYNSHRIEWTRIFHSERCKKMAFSVHHNDYLKTHEDIKSSNMKKIEINLNVTGSHNVSISNEIDIFRMRIVLSNIQTNRFVYLFTVIVSIRDVRMNTKEDFITIRTSEQINRKKRLYFRFHFIPLWNCCCCYCYCCFCWNAYIHRYTPCQNRQFTINY